MLLLLVPGVGMGASDADAPDPLAPLLPLLGVGQ